MSLFEKGKGRRKAQWSIEQLGRILRSHEMAPDSYLPGFRTFPNESAARQAATDLVAEHVKKGFEPADDQARELAASVGAVAVAQPSSALPFRRDIFVENEANGFMVTSMAMAGVNLDEGSKKWDKAVLDGKIIPLSLTQDDSFVVRVVAGEPLTTQEEEEWVARVEWFLHIPDGQLAITGGNVLVNEEYEEGDSYLETYLRVTPIPAGTYRATVLSYVPGINGTSSLDHLAGGYEQSEPLGKWFRRSHSGEPFPDWLRDWCIDDPDVDPGHQQDWTGAERTEVTTEYVNFLVHLLPLTGSPPKEKPALEDGWFEQSAGARLPKECPRGLPARDLTGLETEGKAGEWIYVFDSYDAVSPYPCTAISGGPVTLPFTEIAGLFRLAGLCADGAAPEIRVRFPEGYSYTPPQNWPGNILGLVSGRKMRIAFSQEGAPVALYLAFAALQPFLSAFPDGTEMEFCCAPAMASSMPGEKPSIVHRYRGPMAKGKWRVEETHPQISAEALQGALALALEVASGDGITVADEMEVKATREDVLKNFGDWLEDYPVEFKQGKLVMKEREPEILILFGSAVFARRYDSFWPVKS